MASIKEERVEYHNYLKSQVLYPNALTNEKVAAMASSPLLKPLTAEEFLRRPEIILSQLEGLGIDINRAEEITDAVEIEVKYSGYIKKQLEVIRQGKLLENFTIPTDLVYENVRGLSREETDKLKRVLPITIGQAQRISGVNPSAIQAILIHLKGNNLVHFNQ